MKQEIKEWLSAIVGALVLFMLINAFISNQQVEGSSMVPTLHSGDYLVLRRTQDVKPRDIISLKTALPLTDSDKMALNPLQKLRAGKYKNLIKRVIAKEGDSIKIENHQVIVNGQVIQEPYINDPTEPIDQDIDIAAIPPGKIFVMGDNRGASLDSRSDMVGLIDQKDIIGKVLVRLYPFNQIGPVH